jgi:SAM-dependent methyltransferase
MDNRLLEYGSYLGQLLGGFRAEHEKWLARQRDQDLAPYFPDRKPLDVLDLANGRLRPQYTLLKTAGHHVYGVDLANLPTSSVRDSAYRIARLLYSGRLGARLEPHSSQTLVCGNASVLPFSDDRFDLVTSIAAFEHFLDVPAVVSEVRRVLRPGGLAWIEIHLFASLSGGHNVSCTRIPLQETPRGVEPWDHLRGQRLPITVPLNRWRRDQYIAAFAHYFDILKSYCAIREGDRILTQALEAELSAYSRDELTCSAYIIVARKRQ